MDKIDNGCKCQRCGLRYKVDFNLPDSLWRQISNNYNLLCGMCITRLIEDIGNFDSFDVKRTK